MYCIGPDMHKQDTQACVLDAEGKLVCNERIKTDVRDIGRFFERMEAKDNKIKVTMEATGFYFWIYDCIESRGHRVKVVHPSASKPLMKRAKNDKNDAFMLAKLLRSGSLDGIYVPSKEVRGMRELTRHRESLVRKKGDLKREVLAHLLRKGIKVPGEYRSSFTQKHIAWMRSLDDLVLNEKLDILDMVNEKIKSIEAEIEERYAGNEDIELMLTIPGIAMTTASVIKAEMGDVDRFSSAEDLAAYVGLAPVTCQSGEKMWSGHTRNGNDRIKHVLIEATLFHFHHCPESRISQYYARKKDIIGKKKGVVAGGRKMMEAIYFMLKRGEPFHAH